MLSKFHRTLVNSLVVATLGMAAGPVLAAAQPAPFPQETRLVRFDYDENRTYDILTRPGAITNIKLQDGETLTAFALGDTVQWVFDQAPGNIFIKPSTSGLFTSATLTTNKRSYQLQFRSMATDGNWYQRVSWEYPSLIIARQAAEQQMKDLEAGEVQTSPEKLNFGYSVSGRADFAPTSVFDDGKFTWMRMPSGIQETPVVFLSEQGRLTLVNYSVRGEYLVVQRKADRFVLKSGNREVRVNAKGRGFQGFNSSPLEW